VSVPNPFVEQIGLEVVLSYDAGRKEHVLQLSPSMSVNREQLIGELGLNVLCSDGHGRTVTREEVEAATILAIQEDIGMNSMSLIGDLEWTMAFDDKDKKEKDE
jgi:hypothetical protein